MHRSLSPIDDAERDVGRAKQVARGHAHDLKQPGGVVLGRDFQPDVDQRSQSRVGGSHVARRVRQFVGEQPQVLALEFRRERRGAWRHPRLRFAREHAADDPQHLRRLGGFRQDLGHAAGQRKRPRFTLAVVRGIEHHGNPAGRRIETKLSDELIAVHHRHEHVGNHQIRTIGVNGGQRLAAIRRLEEAVSLMTQQRHEEDPVGRHVVDDQDSRDSQPPSVDMSVRPRVTGSDCAISDTTMHCNVPVVLP